MVGEPLLPDWSAYSTTPITELTELIEHSLLVSYIAIYLAVHLNCLTAVEKAHLFLGCLLHDIGKVAFPQASSARFQSEQELSDLKRHTLLGYAFLRDNKILPEIAEIALYHHERYDGSGYPFGLKGNEIPLLAQICSIADAMEVMLNGRPYQSPKAIKEIAEDFRQNSGGQFHPILVRILRLI
jgi:putative nucleotidyltransferase with HDIG domain